MGSGKGGRRVAILGTRGIPAKYGGFETFADELSVRLVNAGAKVTVYCETEPGAQPESYRGVDLVYIPATACGPLTTILFDLRCLWHARKGFDVVYMLGYGAVPFCLIPRLSGATVWLNVDGIEWARAKWSRLAKVYFRMMEWFSTWVPHRVIADAEGIRMHLESRHRLKVACSVIPYGAPLILDPPDTHLLDEFSLAPGEYYLVVARLEPENHVKEIIQGYLTTDCKRPLIIVGNHLDTAYVQELQEFRDQRLRFVGGVYDKPKLQALRYHAVAYFHGHSVGGTNPSLLEALGCGNLVIAHDNIFNREVCGEYGFYFATPGDIAPLIQQVESLTEAEQTKIQAAMQGRIQTQYNWDKIAADYLVLLKEG